MDVNMYAPTGAKAVCAAELRRGDRVMRRGGERLAMVVDCMDLRSEAGQWILIVSGPMSMSGGEPAAGREDTWVMPIDATVWRFPAPLSVVDRPAKAGMSAMVDTAAAAVAFLGSGLWPSTRREKSSRRRRLSPGAAAESPAGALADQER